MRDIRIDSRFRPMTDAVPCVLCLGNFDGVHKAHAMLVHAAAELACKLGAVPGAFCFTRPSGDYLFENAPPHLASTHRRILRIWGIPRHIVEMADDVKIAKTSDAFVDGFQIHAICLLEVPAIEVSAVIWIRVVKIMDRCDDLVERMAFKKAACLLYTMWVHSYFNAFEHFEAVRKQVVYPFDFSLLGRDVKVLWSGHVLS